MEKEYVLGIDCGTSLAKVMIINKEANLVLFESAELTTQVPQKDYAEQDPDDIWNTILNLIQKLLSNNNIMPSQIAAIGIANQRSTTIIWNKETGIPYGNAILWTDKRATTLCDKANAFLNGTVVERVGIYTIPNTSTMLLKWLIQNSPPIKKAIDDGDALFGTVNSWLLWKLTDGKVHFSDHANMSVTQLQNAKLLAYDIEVLDYLNVSNVMLPELKGTGEIYGITDEKLFSGAKIPITGMMGDQMAATLGQGCITKGMVKATFGTGCFCVMNIGKKYIPPANGLFSPVLWGDKNNPTYGLEGFFEINSQEIDKSALNNIVFQTVNLIKTMEELTGDKILILRVDGGMAKNDYLVQFLTDILGIPVERPSVSEATALGAIYQAGITIGFWESFEKTASLWKLDKRFEPNISKQESNQLYTTWLNNQGVK